MATLQVLFGTGCADYTTQAKRNSPAITSHPIESLDRNTVAKA